MLNSYPRLLSCPALMTAELNPVAGAVVSGRIWSRVIFW